MTRLVLDTNILSELMRAVPNPAVLAWVDAQQPDELYITAITQAEILLGLNLLPDGRRKLALLEAATGMFEEDFQQRILPFDSMAAQEYANLACVRRAAGLPISMADAQIAAIAVVWQAALVTRNVKDFINLPLRLINPWD